MTEYIERETLRCFYPPKEKTETLDQRDIRVLHERVRSLEWETTRLTRDLSERTEELLEALELCERKGLI